MLMLTLALALAPAPAEASDPLAPIIEPYLRIHAALASDKIDEVNAEATAIAEAAGKMEDGAAIADAARTLAAAADIDAARKAFSALSEAMVTRIDGKPAGDVKVAYCPMARKTWLQKGTQIRNPYYGDLMLTCGEFRK